MNQVTFYLWAGFTVLICGAVIATKRAKKQPLPNPESLGGAALAIGGCIAFGKVLYKIAVLQTLRDTLDADGTIALCIGSGFGIYLSVKEIWKLFEDKVP